MSDDIEKNYLWSNYSTDKAKTLVGFADKAFGYSDSRLAAQIESVTKAERDHLADVVRTAVRNAYVEGMKDGFAAGLARVVVTDE
jgi:hypothetical protein